MKTKTKTLFNLADTLSIEDFNDLVLTYLSGDADWIGESFHNMEPITSEPDNYMEKLAEQGFTYSNFPWEELRNYCSALQSHLQTNYIIQIR